MSTVAPLVVQPSFRWAGNDGNWSTFQIGIGTPPQIFDVLPSTCNGEIWIPQPGACPSTYPDCARSRGVLSTTDPTDQGFQAESSKTWSQTGIYGLALEEELFHSNDTGLYGLDSLSLDNVGGIILEEQTIAVIATPNFWLGSLGLSVQPSGFSVQDESHAPLLMSLRAQNLTSSASYGLSVGASYRGAAGGLVIGGYDASAFEPNDVEFSLRANDRSRSLTVSLQSLVITGTVEGQQAMPISVPAGLNMSIDSTVSHIWLPGDMCDRMEALLGLEYDASRGLYLLNSTARDQLRSLSPAFTFTLAANSSSANVTTTITLPYGALDLDVGEPYYNASRPYFPIRRADGPAQLVLGRAFLQEAYVVADWERGNFSLAQAIHQNGVSKTIVPILPPASAQAHPGLNSASIAGIAVGIVAGVGALCLAIWLLWRKRRDVRSKVSKSTAVPMNFLPEKDGYPAQISESVLELASSEHDLHAEKEKRAPAEAMSRPRHELHEDGLLYPLMSNAVYELPGNRVEFELDTTRI